MIGHPPLTKVSISIDQNDPNCCVDKLRAIIHTLYLEKKNVYGCFSDQDIRDCGQWKTYTKEILPKRNYIHKLVYIGEQWT